jgi:hypothetical protein
MRSKTCKYIVIVFFAALSASCIIYINLKWHRVSLYHRSLQLRPGMTIQEVEALLGRGTPIAATQVPRLPKYLQDPVDTANNPDP